MVTIRNVLSVVIGLIVFLLCDFFVPPLLVMIANIPILGICITYFAPDSISLATEFSIWIVSGITLFTANAIAAPNSFGYKIGMFVLAALLIPLYIFKGFLIVKTLGLSFSLIPYLLVSIGAIALSISMGKNDE